MVSRILFAWVQGYVCACAVSHYGTLLTPPCAARAGWIWTAMQRGGGG